MAPPKKDPRDARSSMFPKIRIEPWRLTNYRAAHAWLKQKTGSKVAFAEWVRETLDDEAEAIFEMHGEPPASFFKQRR